MDSENNVGAAPATLGAVVGRCRDCAFGKTQYTWGRNGAKRVWCSNEKVFGIHGTDDDGAEQFEAAELHFGLDFGCVHFAPNAPAHLPPVVLHSESKGG